MSRIGDDVVHGGTFTGHSVSLAAAVKTLEILDETDALHPVLETGVVVTNTPAASEVLELSAAGPAGWLVQLYVGAGPLVPALPLLEFGGELGLFCKRFNLVLKGH